MRASQRTQGWQVGDEVEYFNPKVGADIDKAIAKKNLRLGKTYVIKKMFFLEDSVVGVILEGLSVCFNPLHFRKLSGLQIARKRIK